MQHNNRLIRHRQEPTDATLRENLHQLKGDELCVACSVGSNLDNEGQFEESHASSKGMIANTQAPLQQVPSEERSGIRLREDVSQIRMSAALRELKTPCSD